MKKPAKIAIITVVGIVFLGAFLFDHYLAKPGRVINKMDVGYMATQRNMSYEEVVRIMGPPHRTNSCDASGCLMYWDDELLPLADGAQVTQFISYSYPDVFIGVMFEFYFNNDNQLVSRHRRD